MKFSDTGVVQQVPTDFEIIGKLLKNRPANEAFTERERTFLIAFEKWEKAREELEAIAGAWYDEQTIALSEWEQEGKKGKFNFPPWPELLYHSQESTGLLAEAETAFAALRLDYPSLPKTAPPKKLLPRPGPPLDMYGMTTGPASLAARRGLHGGAGFWTIDHAGMMLRTTPVKGQKEQVFAAYQPDGPRPLINWEDEEETNRAAERFLADLQKQVAKLGSDEADWFDLLLAVHMGINGQGQLRTRDDPSTWAAVQIDDLNRWRSRGKYKGFRNSRQETVHREALERVFALKVVWENAPKGYPKQQAILPYFDVTRLNVQAGFDGHMKTDRYQFFPRHWYDVEMGAYDGRAGMYIEAGLRVVVQIPPNKPTPKAIARYALSFWRMRASNGKGYSLTLRELHDKAGIDLPSWANERPTQYRTQFVEQLKQICDTKQEVALIRMPKIPEADRRGGLELWMNQEIEIAPHDEAAPALLNALSYLASKGEKGRQRQQAIEQSAEARLLALKKRHEERENKAN